jgi:hypothetical protein
MNPDTMHTIILEHWTLEQNRHLERIRALDAAQNILDRLEITDVLDDALDFAAYEDTVYDVNLEKSCPADRYWIRIRQPLERKEALRPILLRNVPSWNKTHRVDNGFFPDDPDYLVESWTHRWHPHPLNPNTQNSIEIEFVSPVEEGQIISDTCTVEKVTRKHRQDDTYLTITCKKKS